jgi:nitroimidazol reductase NimA-like FMN-containing flavoprotein (pyridoxamine 5'-phosphate oxidase superfamily)/GNAT superfamily N-acetyltransferase
VVQPPGKLSTMNERAAKYRLFSAPTESAWSLFAAAPCVQFAGVHAAGKPVLRTLSAVVSDGALCVHGADDGEKLALLGPVVASCEQVVAQVASHWIHPELACPASTYYLSAIAEGELRPVHALERKASILGALMARFQPEGGYAPIHADDQRYRKVLEGLMVAELRPAKLSAKHKLGQHRSKRQIEAVLEGLWKRGGQGDLRAIRLIKQAHPEQPRPSFLVGPEGSELCVAPDEEDARQVAGLLEGQYWTAGFAPDQLAAAQRGSTAWVVAREPESGRVLASARALSDGARLAWLLDVITDPGLRGRGYGRALLHLLMAHPALRGVSHMCLRTRTPGFYSPLGFAAAPAPTAQEMLWRRA